MDISIDGNSDANAKRLEILVNKHCSHAFQKIKLPVSSIVNADLSFPNASAIVLVVESQHSDQTIIQLETAFPRLQSLAINSEIYNNQHLPHLRKFFLDVREPNIDSLINFMRLNPQLRSFQSTVPDNATYLTTLNEFLPELEELSVELMTISRYNMEEPWPTTRFSGVRHFSVKLDTKELIHRPVLESIQFDSLQSYSVQFCTKEKVDFLIRLMVNNTALKKVVMDSREVSYQQFTTLIASLPELEELSIGWGDPQRGNIIHEFLNHVTASNHKLAKLSIKISFNPIRVKGRLESIPQGWSYDEAWLKANPWSLQILRNQ